MSTDGSNKIENKQQRVRKRQSDTTKRLEKEKMTVSELRRESIGEEKEALKVIFFFEKLAILQFVDIPLICPFATYFAMEMGC